MTFDFKPYAFTIAEGQSPPWNMDERHIQMLYKSLRSYAGPFRAVEIGSYRGASTAAFVEAINAGSDMTLLCVEPSPTPELYAVLAHCKRPERIKVFSGCSHECNWQDHCDFLFVDGCHDWPAIYEVGMGLAKNVPVIAMHDTAGLFECWGSALAFRMLEQSDRSYVLDNEKREGENTDRGFCVAVRPGYEGMLP